MFAEFLMYSRIGFFSAWDLEGLNMLRVLSRKKVSSALIL